MISEEKDMRKCPLCECEKKTILHKMKNTMLEDIQKRTGYPTDYDIVFCNRCGMVYTDINIKESNIDKYYSDENMYSNMSNLKSNVYLKSQVMYYSFISKYINKDSIIVDIGCGNGNLLNFLRTNKFFKLFGIDPSNNSIEVLKKKGIMGYVGNVYQCDKMDIPKADMIISTGVLEHLLFPKLALASMANVINDEGYIYICIPATEKYDKLDMPEANFFNHEHINHFTENTLRFLAESVDLQTVESSVNRACDEIEFTISMVLKKKKVYNKEMYNYQFDLLGKRSVKRYYQQRHTNEEKINHIIVNIISNNTPIIIWGTGNYASSILNEYQELKNNIIFFVDNNREREGTEYYNKKIHTPDILKNIKYNNVLLIVCVMQAKKEISEDIGLLGIKNKIIYL